MTSHGSVTNWIARLQEGDRAAAQPLWERYVHRLVELARRRLRGAPRRVADEDDVALSAFGSFCQRAEQGRFPQLADRDDLWRLLVVITARKASHLKRDQQRQKRDAGAGAAGLDDVIDPEPSPALAAELTEQIQRLLACLGSDALRQVALYKMDGYTNEEIAARLDCAPRTVERKLHLIRKTWESASGHEPDAPRGG